MDLPQPIEEQHSSPAPWARFAGLREPAVAPRFMGLFARKKGDTEMQRPNLIPDLWHLTSDSPLREVKCPKKGMASECHAQF